MGMAAILLNGAEPFDQIVNILSTEGAMWTIWNLLKTVQAVSERKPFKDFTTLYMYIAQWQGHGQIAPKILTVAKQFLILI